MRDHSTFRRISEWGIAVLLSLSFVGAGLPKVNPGEAMVRRFEAWGYTEFFATVIGVVETVGGLLVLLPQTRLLGAGLIAADMVGATWTHLRTGIGSPVASIAYLVLALALIWIRTRPRGAQPGA